MIFKKIKKNNIIINVNTENIKLVSQSFNLFKAHRVEFLNNLTSEQVHILFNTSNIILLDNFKVNIVKRQKLNILEFFLSQEKLGIFFNSKLGRLL